MSMAADGLWLSGAITTVLAIASSVGWALHRRVPQGQSHAGIDNLRARVRSWWLMAGVLGAALWLGTLATMALFAGIALLAFREYVAVPGPYPLHTRFAGFGICVIGVAFMPALLTLHITGYAGRNALLLAWLILVIQSSDVLQYIWGKLFGRRLIAPGISPSKTVEGFAGGVASATLLGAGLWWITPFSVLEAASVSLVLTLLGFAGGLVLSAQKRARGIKDWGTLIRGHGGMLDRVDSLWLPAPLFYAYVRFAA